MDGFEFLLVFLGIVITLAICYIIATEFYEVAKMKGYSDRKYFWFPFLLGIAGYCLIIALPNRFAEKSAESAAGKVTAADELPDL